MSKWLYKGKEVNNIEDFGEQIPFGFVYLIGNTITGKMYIGKKFLKHKKTKKLGKNGNKNEDMYNFYGNYDLTNYFDYYNNRRPHQSFDFQPPRQMYRPIAG